ncbi:Transaldolase [Planctopirus limnophila DSM 3776]|uniref:Transaldolase n=1 Tax=Planctopirus limnophila (strain ATCC 43296 / DSM 3776 / IFAM 1008 / Mu 290) TaxID=521674 RepID=D5SX22_PLAL2|nr:transaldolase family protein [Planctopirus limnophila]ADG69644.1 Transaldolase [Planctopirus limnophila DSM 3776]
MPTPLETLVACGTKVWLDSIDPALVVENRKFGATGATSNPIIIADLLKTGRFDDQIRALVAEGHSDEAIAWAMTDRLVRQAQEVFASVYTESAGNNGYVSFELDPLLEDTANTLSVAEKAKKYVELGQHWAAGHSNRMIKVPATPGGLAALEELAASGITLNVTLIFSERQYEAAREAVWKGAQRHGKLERFKSVYSIFVSRIDVYTKKHVPTLIPAAQGQVGIVNAQRLWAENQKFWADKKLPLQQEIIFASTGTKDPAEAPDRYVSALAGSDIQTNPPATNAAVQSLTGKVYTRKVDQLPPADVLADIDAKVDFAKMEQVLMEEGLAKFADPFKSLLQVIASKR